MAKLAGKHQSRGVLTAVSMGDISWVSVEGQRMVGHAWHCLRGSADTVAQAPDKQEHPNDEDSSRSDEISAAG